MDEQANAEHLLDTARRLLRDELMPALPSDKRHSALMIANAMGIASRQLNFADAPARDELASLEALLSLSSSAQRIDAVTLRTRLVSANRLLCARLRDGLADDGAARALCLAHLVKVARRRVEVSNPKYLVGRAQGVRA